MVSQTNLEALYSAFQLLTEGVEEYSLILLDEQGNILTWNKGVGRLKGYTAEEIIGQNISIFFLPEDRQAGLSQKLLNEARQHGHAVVFGRRLRKNGTIFWGKIEITAVRGGAGQIIGFTKLTRELKEETSIGNFWFDNEGVLHTKASPVPYTPEKIQEFRQLIRAAIGNQKLCCIADIRDAVLTDDTLPYARKEIANLYKAVAFITGFSEDRITATVVQQMPPQIPVKTFATREKAKEWMKAFI